MRLCLRVSRLTALLFFFFFNDTATTEIYTLSLHDALPISALVKSGKYGRLLVSKGYCCKPRWSIGFKPVEAPPDRKSTRLNSSHLVISYAVFCLKKKKTQQSHQHYRQHDHRSNRRRTSPLV